MSVKSSVTVGPNDKIREVAMADEGRCLIVSSEVHLRTILAVLVGRSLPHLRAHLRYTRGVEARMTSEAATASPMHDS
jgi:hypothetical protein